MTNPDAKQSDFKLCSRVSAVLNLLSGGTWPDTLCFRMACEAQKGSKGAQLFCKFMNYLDPDHCDASVKHRQG